MLIAQLSDLHILAEGKKAYGRVDTAKNLAFCIDTINKRDPLPDVVLITGDITGNGKLEDLECAASYLQKLLMPYLVVPGNHDDPSHFAQVFSKPGCPLEHRKFVNYIIDDYPIRFIALDSTSVGQSGGELCSERLAWLEQALDSDKEKPTIIFMHHPPVKCGVLETDEDGFIGADLLGELVEKYNNIERILCGHIHLTAHIHWRGTVVSTARSMGLGLVLDLTKKEASQFYANAPGYMFHYWTPEKNLVTYSILPDANSKKHYFEQPF